MVRHWWNLFFHLIAKYRDGYQVVDSQTEAVTLRKLFYPKAGKSVPIERVYNRTIVDELERKQIKLPFDYRDELDLERSRGSSERPTSPRRPWPQKRCARRWGSGEAGRSPTSHTSRLRRRRSGGWRSCG